MNFIYIFSLKFARYTHNTRLLVYLHFTSHECRWSLVWPGYIGFMKYSHQLVYFLCFSSSTVYKIFQFTGTVEPFWNMSHTQYDGHEFTGQGHLLSRPTDDEHGTYSVWSCFLLERLESENLHGRFYYILTQCITVYFP